MYLTVIQIVNNGILPSFDWIAKTEVKKNKYKITKNNLL